MTDHDTTIREAREALSRLDKAGEEIGEVAANVRSRWRMSIPANPNRDTDLIVSDACMAGQRSITALLAVIEQQQATIERFEASNRYGDQMIFAQSDVIGELNNDVSDLRATIDRQAETLRQVREYALAHAESAGHPELGGAESQIGRDILRILDGEGA